MSEKRTMTINLSESDMQALEQLCAEKELSKTAVVRQALRLYQLVNVKVAGGGKLLIEDSKRDKAELIVV